VNFNTNKLKTLSLFLSLAELDDTNRRIQVLELQISNATILAAKSISLSEVTQQNELENGDSPPVSPIQNVSSYYYFFFSFLTQLLFLFFKKRSQIKNKIKITSINYQ